MAPEISDFTISKHVLTLLTHEQSKGAELPDTFVPPVTFAVSHNITQYATYVGRIGLAPTNLDTPNLPYPEYRDRAPVFGGDGDCTWSIGLGDGDGSRLINLAWDGFGMGNPTLNIHKTNLPYQGKYTVHAVLGNAARVNVRGGTVAITPDFDMESSVFVLNV